jgi:2,5-diketo-D-gluconate reductase B
MIRPSLWLNTTGLPALKVSSTVCTALELGYRAIDIAQVDHREAEISQGIKRSGISREALFITTKLWVDTLNRELLIPALHKQLNALGTNYVDLALIHWPSPRGVVPMAEYMEALYEAQGQGLVRTLGVANFSRALMRQAMAAIGAESIAVNYIERHPYLQNQAVIEHARQHGIAITAYSPLAQGKVLTDPLLLEIAQRMEVSPAQVALAWSLRQGIAVTLCSTCPVHLAENLTAQNLVLEEQDMNTVACLDQGLRFTNPQGLAPVWDQ